MTLPTGAWGLRFSGPPENLTEARQALAGAGFAVFPGRPDSPTAPADAELGWLEVQSHEGGDGPPSAGFQQERMEAASSAVAPHGYVRRSYGVVMGKVL